MTDTMTGGTTLGLALLDDASPDRPPMRPWERDNATRLLSALDVHPLGLTLQERMVVRWLAGWDHDVVDGTARLLATARVAAVLRAEQDPEVHDLDDQAAV